MNWTIMAMICGALWGNLPHVPGALGDSPENRVLADPPGCRLLGEGVPTYIFYMTQHDLSCCVIDS